jgi:lipoyl(octanoyl) transferase
MAYALVDVHKRRIKVRCFVQALEEACIRFLAKKSIEGVRKAGAPGVWVQDKKIAAVGVHFSRGVSMHGVALNLSPDLTPFELISPCGFGPNSVTSLSQITGKKWSVREEAPEFAGILMDCIKERSAP